MSQHPVVTRARCYVPFPRWYSFRSPCPRKLDNSSVKYYKKVVRRARPEKKKGWPCPIPNHNHTPLLSLASQSHHATVDLPPLRFVAAASSRQTPRRTGGVVSNASNAKPRRFLLPWCSWEQLSIVAVMMVGGPNGVSGHVSNALCCNAPRKSRSNFISRKKVVSPYQSVFCRCSLRDDPDDGL